MNTETEECISEMSGRRHTLRESCVRLDVAIDHLSEVIGKMKIIDGANIHSITTQISNLRMSLLSSLVITWVAILMIMVFGYISVRKDEQTTTEIKIIQLKVTDLRKDVAMCQAKNGILK